MLNNILSYLTSDELKRVLFKKYESGSFLFHENDKCDVIGIIINGEIDIVSFSLSGNELLYNSLSKNNVFGNNLIFSSDPHYKGNVVAKSDCEVAYISFSNLQYLLMNNKPFLLEYLKVQSDFGKNLNSTIKLLTYESAIERLEYWFFINHNVIHYKSVTELATKLHLKRETLSRLISNLEKKNAIKRSNHTITKIN